MEFIEGDVSEPAFQLSGHKGSVVYVLSVEDRGLLISAGEDKTVRVWDVTTRRALKCFCRCFEDDIDSLFHCSMFPNTVIVLCGRKVVFLDLDISIMIDTTPLAVLSTSVDVHSIAVSSLLNTLILGDEDGSIGFYSFEAGISDAGLTDSYLYALDGAHTNIVSSLLPFEKDGKQFLISSSFDCSCVLWNLSSTPASAICRLDFANLGAVTGQMFNPPFVHSIVDVDDTMIIAALGDGTVRVIRKVDLHVMDSQEFHRSQVVSIAKLGALFVSAGTDGNLQVLSIQKTTKKEKGRMKTKASIRAHQRLNCGEKVNSIAFLNLQETSGGIAVAGTGDKIALFTTSV